MKNNHLDYSLNIWLSISILGSILNFIYAIFIGESSIDLTGTGVMIFIIFLAMMIGLPFYFLLIKISKKVFDLKIPNWQIKLILMFITLFIILICHILTHHKIIHEAAYYESRHIEPIENYFIRYLIITIHFAKFYLITAVFSIGYFQIERANYIPSSKSKADILDDDLDFS